MIIKKHIWVQNSRFSVPNPKSGVKIQALATLMFTLWLMVMIFCSKQIKDLKINNSLETDGAVCRKIRNMISSSHWESNDKDAGQQGQVLDDG